MGTEPLNVAQIRHILLLMLIALKGPDPEVAEEHLAELVSLFRRTR